MDKSYRLFLRNLPPDIGKDELENLFKEHGTVTNIDIKEKIQNDGSRIAFINFGTTDKRLNTCFRTVNGTNLRDYAIHVEVAKESFLDRLKREREEAANQQAPLKETVVAHDQPIEKINIKVPKNVKSKPTKRIYHFDEVDNVDLTEDHGNQSFQGPDFTHDPALRVETIPVKKQMIIESQIPQKCDSATIRIPKKEVISESEIKRLASVKQRIQSFKAKEHMISSALKSVDSGTKSNKLIFPENIDEIIGSEEKRSKSLFDEDDEDLEDQGDWNEDKFQHDDKRNAKLTMSMKNLGRDKRFEIDDRFLDDDKDTSSLNVGDENEESDLRNETKWQLDILQNVLGKPFKCGNDKLVTKKQNKMVRYDPTTSGHQAHEIEMTSKSAIKVNKKKVATSQVEPEEAQIHVSSDVFYKVSENLTESLKPQEEFSLLKSFGTATETDKNKSEEYDASMNKAQNQKWERSYDDKNPFKYESSEDETGDLSMDHLTSNEFSAKIKMNSQIKERNDTFFFDTNDQRFNDAEEFFKTRSSATENFTNVRRQLKQIVRSKIRNNVKRNTPWRNTKIRKQAKVR